MTFLKHRFLKLAIGTIWLLAGSPMTRGQDAAPLPLVGHWTLDDVDGVLKDSGPNKLNGKVNGATSTDGKFAKALQFKDGASTRIDNNPILNGSDKFTLSLWM